MDKCGCCPSKKETTTGNHNWAQCRDKQIKGSTAPVDTTISQLLHLYDLGKHRERTGRKIVRSRIPSRLQRVA